MKRIVLIVVSLLIPFFAFAAPDGDKETRLLPSRFGDNWFVSTGVVGNTIAGNKFGPVSLGAEIYVGKWFVPGFGLRVGASGWQQRPNGVDAGWFSGEKPFWWGHADMDIMWDVINSFRYNRKRVWSAILFGRIGGMMNRQMGGATESYINDTKGHVSWNGNPPAHWELSGGLGLSNHFRVSERVSLYLDVAMMAAREKAYRQRGDVIFFPYASAGVTVDVGRVGYRKPGKETEYVFQPIYIDRVEVRMDTVVVEKAVPDEKIIEKMREEPLTLFFDIDVTVLTQREMDHLEFYAKYVLTPDSQVLLTGSADKETGNSEHNQWLSEKRNEYVRNILIRQYGLKPENIQTIANGDRKNEYRTPEQNRCVTISFIK